MADASGTINLATAPPVRGYYQGADIHGLFWSQSPLAANSGQAAITALHLDDPSSVCAHQAVLTLEEGGTVQDRRVLTFVSNDPDVMRDDVRSDGLIGVFYSKRSARKRPVVVALGGSEGGLSFADWIGPKLASRGFAVFGLNYFSPPSSAVAGVSTSSVAFRFPRRSYSLPTKKAEGTPPSASSFPNASAVLSTCWASTATPASSCNNSLPS